ncbi:MAG: class I SAM-dependent methyltransferase [Vulcanimicrobiaceae bacterium]|jgi:SAM-dependent methyltransferase
MKDSSRTTTATDVRQPENQYGAVEEDDDVRERYQLTASVLLPYLHSGMRVLEMGCYRGGLRQFFPRDLDYHGVDFDQAALQTAEARGIVPHVMDADRGFPEGLPSESFDAVIACEVLEHLVNPRAILRDLVQRCKSGGRVLISLPNENTLYHRLMSLSGLGVDSCAFELYKHLHLPTIAQSRAFIAGEVKILTEKSYVLPSVKNTRLEGAGAVMRIIPRRGWQVLADVMPGLFARGRIYLGTPANR